MIQPQTLEFLSNLKENNNKNWFEEHRNEYELARKNFTEFVENLIFIIGKWDKSIAKFQPKDCVFRIYRDVRFSKDKTPFKTHFGAYFSTDGKKSTRAGYYFHLEPGNTFLGGGVWQPQPQQLKNIRQEIDYNLSEFEAIINNKSFKKFYNKIEGARLKTTPKNYVADNPAIEYLKQKDFEALTHLTDEQVISPKLLTICDAAFKELIPFNQFLDRAFE